MSLKESLIQEFDLEMANTRKTLERVPEDKFAWKPHAKSFSMIELAAHLANLPGWIDPSFTSDSIDFMPGGVPIKEAKTADSRAELLARFDKNCAAARAALAGASDEQLLAIFTLLANGKIITAIPRIAMLRSFIFNHNIHHRAQLGMYLRLNDIPLPPIYGPSADESM